MAVCGTRFAYIEQDTSFGKRRALVRIRCKSWNCPVCRRWKTARVIDKLKEIYQRKQLYLLTLTVRRVCSAQHSYAFAAHSWNRVASYIRRRAPGTGFFRVAEGHRRDGFCHLHIIMDRWIFDGHFFDLAHRAGFGRIAHVVRIDTEGAGKYLAKYLCKDRPPAMVEALKNGRRTRIVVVSRCFGAIYPKNGGWKLRYITRHPFFVCQSLALFTNLANRDTNRVYRLKIGKNKIVSEPDPGEIQDGKLRTAVKRVLLPYWNVTVLVWSWISQTSLFANGDRALTTA